MHTELISSVINLGTGYIWMKIDNVHLQIFVSYLGLKWLPVGFDLVTFNPSSNNLMSLCIRAFCGGQFMTQWVPPRMIQNYRIRTIKAGKPLWDHPVPSPTQHCKPLNCITSTRSRGLLNTSRDPDSTNVLLSKAYVPFTLHGNLHLSLPVLDLVTFRTLW